MPDPPRVDADVHCAPRSWDDLAPYLDRYWLDYVDGAGIRLGPGGAYLRDPRPPSTAAELAGFLDESGAGVAVVTCLTLFDAYRNPRYQAALARALNEWLRREWLDRDARLRASIVVPWTDPVLAAIEIERAAADPRFVQVLLPVRSDTPYGAAVHHPLYRAAAEHGLPVALHAWGPEARAPTPSGFAGSQLEDYLSNTTIAQRQVVSLVAEGVFELFPALRVVLLECGFAWLPPLLWRFDKDWKGIRFETPWVRELPSTYVRRSVFATAQPAQVAGATDTEVARTVGLVGGDRILYASDHPHDHGSGADELVAALDEPTRAAILGGNAAALYGLVAGPA